MSKKRHFAGIYFDEVPGKCYDTTMDKVKVMIGGSPISQKFADEIGADGYSTNAVEAVKLAGRLLA